MKLSNNILTFAQGNTSVFEKFADYMRHYRSEIQGVKSLVFDKNVSFAEKEAEMNKDLLKTVERYVGRSKPSEMSFAVWAGDPTVKYHTFAVVSAMIDAILPETLINSIGLYADIKYAGFGDSFQFNIKPRDLFAVSRASKGKRTGFTQRQFGTTATLAPVNHRCSVEIPLYKVLSGQESLAEYTMKAVRSIESELTYNTYDAMVAGLNAINSGANTLHLPSYSQDTAINLAQKVTAWNNGNKAVFVGTQIALSKILPADSNYRYLLDSEYVKLGYVKEFNGFGVMVLPQIADYTSSTFGLKLADNELYVISPSADKLVKVGVEGDTLTFVSDIDGNANLMQTATIQKMWDVGFITSSIAGMIELG